MPTTNPIQSASVMGFLLIALYVHDLHSLHNLSCSLSYMQESEKGFTRPSGKFEKKREPSAHPSPRYLYHS